MRPWPVFGRLAAGGADARVSFGPATVPNIDGNSFHSLQKERRARAEACHSFTASHVSFSGDGCSGIGPSAPPRAALVLPLRKPKAKAKAKKVKSHDLAACDPVFASKFPLVLGSIVERLGPVVHTGKTFVALLYGLLTAAQMAADGKGLEADVKRLVHKYTTAVRQVSVLRSAVRVGGRGLRGCIRREGTSEAARGAGRQAVVGGCQSGWRRLLSVTNAIEAGAWRQGDSGWA